jgi:hypothetical protein
MSDEVSRHYTDLLAGTCDCVDRIVLTAYNTLCYTHYHGEQRVMGRQRGRQHATAVRRREADHATYGVRRPV